MINKIKQWWAALWVSPCEAEFYRELERRSQ